VEENENMRCLMSGKAEQIGVKGFRTIRIKETARE